MFHSLLFPGFRTFCLVVFACGLSVSANRLSAQAPPPETPPQDAPAKTDSTAKAPPTPAQTEEVSSHDTPATFKVRVNLVLVRVVVRDSKGKIVPNLKKKIFSSSTTKSRRQFLHLPWKHPRLAPPRRLLLRRRRLRRPARMPLEARPSFYRNDLSPWSSTMFISRCQTPYLSGTRQHDSLKGLQPATAYPLTLPPGS